jgi:N-acetylneuraminate synthase
VYGEIASMSVKFISEVSSNHSKDLGRCLEFVDVSAAIGCDAVKFQLFKISEMFAPEILQKSEKHRARAEWELPLEFLEHIAERCQHRGIEFSCTPFYLAAVDALEPFVDFYKVASYELLWDALLLKVAKTGKPIVLSTGMASLDEILHAVQTLRDASAGEISLLHCVSAYPTPIADANLAAIQTISEATGCQVGWSDHTVSPGVIQRAVHRWQAPIVEFHLDLDEAGAEFGAGHCWLPQEMSIVIEDIRNGFVADGVAEKAPAASEAPDREWRADPSDGLRPMRSVRRTWRDAS